MKKMILAAAFSAAAFTYTQAQVSNAQDFSMTSCDGAMQHLFADYLDNGEVVIMEFFMTCSSCQNVAAKLTPMHTALDAAHPGMINFFVLAYTNSYNCTTVSNWRNTYAPNAVAFDSGAVQVAYYGGFAMPTVVVVAGAQHEVLYNSNFDGAAGDTAAIRTAIENFFQPAGINDVSAEIKFQAYPNPVSDILTVELDLPSSEKVKMDMVDVSGRVVRTMGDDFYTAGKQKLMIDTANLPDGMYFIRVAAGVRQSQFAVSVKH